MPATVELKELNNATVLPIPPTFLEQLGLKANMPMSLQVFDDSLVLRPEKKHYRLDELLAGDFQHDGESQPWARRSPVGLELI